MSQYYVNTASTAGGDGTTNGTAGSTRAFASLSEAEAALQTTLTENMYIDCCGTTADSTAVTIDGWTNGSYRLTVRGNDSDSAGAHKGTSYNTGKYRIATTGGTFALRVSESNTTVFQIQVNLTNATGWATIDEATTISGCIADSLILKGDTSARPNGLQWSLSTNSFNKAKNLISYDMDVAIYIRQDSAGSGNSEIINCTAVDSTTGIRGRGTNYIDTYNNLSVLNTSDWLDSGGFSSNAAKNAFKNTGTACPGSTDIDLSTYAGTDIFANYSGDDFGLLSTGSAYSSIDNDGEGPSSNSRVTAYDINNDTRSGTTTSVGADLIVAGGGTSYTDTLSLGATASLAHTGKLTIPDSISLAVTAAISKTASLSIPETIALATSHSMSVAAFTVLQEALSFAVSMGKTADSIGDLREAITFALTQGLQFSSGASTIDESLTFSTAMTIAHSGLLSIPETITLGAIAGLSDSATVAFNEAITLAATGAMGETNQLIAQEYLSLAASMDQSYATTLEAVASLVFAIAATFRYADTYDEEFALGVALQIAVEVSGGWDKNTDIGSSVWSALSDQAGDIWVKNTDESATWSN